MDKASNQATLLSSTIKRVLFISTISLFSLSALIGIIVILGAATGNLTGQIISTTALLGFFALFNLNNLIRTENPQPLVRYPAIIAMVANVFWLVPWLIMIWGIFEPNCDNSANYSSCMSGWYSFQEVAWQTINVAAIMSILASIVSNFMSFKCKTAAVRVLSIITIVSGILSGINEIIMINIPLSSELEIWRFFLITLIILVFGLITTPIVEKISRSKYETKQKDNNPTAALNEQQLRAQIEAEVRAKIEAEMNNQNNLNNNHPSQS